MATVTKPIALDESLNTTELSSRNVADVLAQELSAVATAIGGIAVPSADHVSYDNSGSGLSATDVQNALDEIVSDIPTVNDGTLTIQKNGTTVATFSANASSNASANITVPTTTSELTNNSDFVSDASYVHTDNNFTTAEKTKLSGIESGAEVNVQSDWNQTDNTADDYIKNKPSSEVKSATDTFTTVNGGLLEECIIDLVPVQSGSGDPSPDNVRPISGHTEVDLYNVGFNLWDEEWEVGDISAETGANTAGNTTIRTKNYINVIPGKTYYCLCPGSNTLRTRWYDADKNYIGYTPAITYNSVFTVPSNAHYLRFTPQATYGTTYNHDICINISETSKNGTYEPYLGTLYTIQIGQTVYGGTVDLVSGVMVSNKAMIDLSTISSWSDASGGRKTSSAIMNVAKAPETTEVSCECDSYKPCSSSDLANDPTLIGIAINSGKLIVVRTADGNAPSSGMLCYELATPQTITLTPQQIEALPKENNLSTPLDGQSIQTDGVKYREVFVFDDVEKVVNLRVPISMLGTDESGRTTASQAYASGDYFYKDGYMCKALTSISAGATLTLNTNYSQATLDDVLESKIDRSEVYNNAGSHNAIYRGKYLGSSVTAEQWASIVAGTFDDLFIGDYWTIDSVNWRIAHFDYWYRVGDTECTDHHVVIVPDTVLYNAKMNSTDITTGGYYNSEMRGGADYLVSGSSNLYTAKTKVDSAFGSAHILTHRETLTNAASSGNASGWAWYDSSLDLMSEVMVYGTLAWSVGGKGYEVGDGKGQLALFRHDISKATNRASWWLRGVFSAANFAYVASDGIASRASASASLGVRPAFAIK